MINRTKSAPSVHARFRSTGRSVSQDNELCSGGSEVSSNLALSTSHPATTALSSSSTTTSCHEDEVSSVTSYQHAADNENGNIGDRYRNFHFNPDEFDMTCQRQYLKEGPVILSAGVQQQDRYLFLFTDILLIAKQRDESNFKVKENIRLCEVWLSMRNLDDVAEASLSRDKSFVIGWPTTNYVATFHDKNERDDWFHQLSQGIASVKEKEFPKVTTIHIHNKQVKSSEIPPVVCQVNHLQSSVDVLRIALEMFDISGTEATSQYQLWVISSKENAAYPLYGHEIPFSIFLSHVRDQMQTGKVEFPDLHQLENLATNPPCEIRCHFVVKPKKSSGNKLKNKVERFRKKIMQNRADSVDSAHLLSHSPPLSEKHPSGVLFGQPLDSVTTGGKNNASLVPAPVMNMIRCLFEYGLYTEGIFRRTPKTSSVRELRDKLDMGEDVVFDHVSPCVTASLLKEYFRTMPESLLVYDRLHGWLQLLSEPDHASKIDMAKQLLSSIPPSHMELLRHLICLLHHVALNQDANMMNAPNLAICFGYGLLLPPVRSDEELGRTAKRVSEITQFLIENAKELFGASTLCLLGPPPNPISAGHDSSEESDFIGSHTPKTTSSVDSLLRPNESSVTGGNAPSSQRRRPLSSYNAQRGTYQNSSQDSGLADTGGNPSSTVSDNSSDVMMMTNSTMTSSFSDTYRSYSLSEADTTEDENFEHHHHHHRYRHCQHPSTSSSCASSAAVLPAGALRQPLGSSATVDGAGSMKHFGGASTPFSDQVPYPQQSFILTHDLKDHVTPAVAGKDPRSDTDGNGDFRVRESGSAKSSVAEGGSKLSPLTRRLHHDPMRRPPNYKFNSATLPGGSARRLSNSETVAVSAAPLPKHSSSARVGRQAAGHLDCDIVPSSHNDNSSADHMTISSVDSLYNSAESSTSIDSRFGHLRNSKRMNMGTLKRSESGEHLFIRELIEVDAGESSSPSPPQSNKKMLKRSSYLYRGGDPLPTSPSPGSITSDTSGGDSHYVDRSNCEKTSSCDSSCSNVTSKSGSSQSSPSPRPRHCTCSDSSLSLVCELHSSYELYINNPKRNCSPPSSSAGHTQTSSGGSLSLSCVSEVDRKCSASQKHELTRGLRESSASIGVIANVKSDSNNSHFPTPTLHRSDNNSALTKDGQRLTHETASGAHNSESPMGRGGRSGVDLRRTAPARTIGGQAENKFTRPHLNHDENRRNYANSNHRSAFAGLVHVDSVDSSTVTESSDDSTPHVSRESSRAQDFADTASQMFGGVAGDSSAAHPNLRTDKSTIIPGSTKLSPFGAVNRPRQSSETIDELSIFVETRGVPELSSDVHGFMNSGGLVLSSERSTPRAMSRSSSSNDTNDGDQQDSHHFHHHHHHQTMSNSSLQSGTVSSGSGYKASDRLSSPDGVFKAMPADAVSSPLNKARRYRSTGVELAKLNNNNNDSNNYKSNQSDNAMGRTPSPHASYKPVYESNTGLKGRPNDTVFPQQYRNSSKHDATNINTVAGGGDRNNSIERDFASLTHRFSSGMENSGLENRYDKYRGTGLLNKPPFANPPAMIPKNCPTYEEALKRRSISVTGSVDVMKTGSTTHLPPATNATHLFSPSDRPHPPPRAGNKPDLMTSSAIDFLPTTTGGARSIEEPVRPGRRSEPIGHSSSSNNSSNSTDVHKLLIPVFPKGKVRSHVSRYDRNGPRRKTIGGGEVMDENSGNTPASTNLSSAESGSADNLNNVGFSTQPRIGCTEGSTNQGSTPAAGDIAQRLKKPQSSRTGEINSDESAATGVDPAFRLWNSRDINSSLTKSGSFKHLDPTGNRSAASGISWSVKALKQFYSDQQQQQLEQQQHLKDQQRNPWARDRSATINTALPTDHSTVLPKSDYFNSLTRTPRKPSSQFPARILTQASSYNSSAKPGSLVAGNRSREMDDSRLHSARERSFTYSDELSKRKFIGSSMSNSSVVSTVKSSSDLSSSSHSSSSHSYRQSYVQSGKAPLSPLSRLSPQANYPVIKPPPLTSSNGQFPAHQPLQLSSNSSHPPSDSTGPCGAVFSTSHLATNATGGGGAPNPRRYGSVNVIKADYSSNDSKEYKKRTLPPVFKKGTISYV